MKFVGEFERQVDDKGRVALPATYRDAFADVCYLAKGTDKCVDLFTERRFDECADEMVAKVERGEIGRNALRAFASTAVRAKVDSQGRVNVSDGLLTWADLGKDRQALVVGGLDRLQLWLPDRYRLVVAEGDDDLEGRPLLPAGSPAR